MIVIGSAGVLELRKIEVDSEDGDHDTCILMMMVERAIDRWKKSRKCSGDVPKLQGFQASERQTVGDGRTWCQQHWSMALLWANAALPLSSLDMRRMLMREWAMCTTDEQQSEPRTAARASAPFKSRMWHPSCHGQDVCRHSNYSL